MLRPYQTRFVGDIRAAWQCGSKAVLGVMPTGGGKTVCFSDITAEHRGLSCTIAHRQELVGQISLSLARAGVIHRIIAPNNIISSILAEHRAQFGRTFYSPTALAAAVGIDTLLAREDAVTRWAEQVTQVTIDEAHHVLLENKWGRGVAMFPNALVLGVTATPQRADGKGLGAHHDGIFDAMVLGPTTADLIAAGYLSPYEIVVPESDFDVEHLRVTEGGDFSPKQLKEASEASHIVGDVVEQYLKWANGLQGITFATDVETANKMAARYRERGVIAEAVSAKTPENVRNEFVRRFRRREITQLVNVDLFGEGFDVPGVEVVSSARPSMSLSVVLQQWGRCLRIAEGKRRGLIIDHVSNYKLHGLPDKPRRWTLDRRDKRAGRYRDPEEIPLTVCEECSKPYPRISRACMWCGHVPAPTPGGRRTPEQVDGDLMLLDAATLAELRASIQLEAPAEVAARVGAAAGPLAAKAAMTHQGDRIRAQKELSDMIALWAGRERDRGRSDEESYRRFFFWLGVDVLTALAQPRAEMQEMIDTIKKELGTIYAN